MNQLQKITTYSIWKNGHFLILLVGFPFIGFGQDLSQSFISTQGNYSEGSEMSISWTIGGNFTETITSEDNYLTQGFQQPMIEIRTLVNEKNPVLEASVFPNPTNGHINIDVPQSSASYRLELFNKNGALLLRSEKDVDISNLDLSPFSSGVYILRITDLEIYTTASFEIIKF